MKSDNSMNELNKILITMLSESDKGAVPRIIMVGSRNKLWRQIIAEGIDLDSGMFKSSEYVLSCRRYSNDELELKKFNGCLKLALHNLLTCVKDTDNMIITVENMVYKFLKGVRVQRTIKVVYIVLQN